jgi:hypothetical protein
VRELLTRIETEPRPSIKRKAARARRGIPNRGQHRQAAKRAAADIEGHSTATEHSQPRRLSDNEASFYEMLTIIRYEETSGGFWPAGRTHYQAALTFVRAGRGRFFSNEIFNE